MADKNNAIEKEIREQIRQSKAAPKRRGHILRALILLLILAAFFATPILRDAVRKWREKSRERGRILLTDGILMLGTLLLIVLCLMQLASDSYNPFIYYRF